MEQNSATPAKSPDKKSKLSLKLVVAIGLAALLLAFLIWHIRDRNSKTVNTTDSASTISRRDQQAGDINIKLNQTATLGGIKLKVTKTALSISSIPGAPMINGEPQPTQFLIADITLEGTAKAAANYSYAQFSALNDSKTEAALAPSNLPLGISHPLGSGSLSSGKKVSAQVVMVLPDKFKYYYVVFTPMQGVQKRIVIQP
jgi:hypothetical protein